MLQMNFLRAVTYVHRGNIIFNVNSLVGVLLGTVHPRPGRSVELEPVHTGPSNRAPWEQQPHVPRDLGASIVF